MADYSYSSDVVLSELMRISKDFIWKNPSEALKYEDSANSIEVEQYNLAVQGKLIFDLVYKFDKEALMNAGFSESDAEILTDSPMAIPEDKRELCAQKETEWLLKHYEEKNNYYRMLNGLPDIEDTEFLYNTEYPDISDSLTPIHLLDSAQLYALEANGYLSKLMDANPSKKYLNHLTEKKINIYTARNSADYAILWITQSSFTTLITEFKETYNACRYMVLNIYYLKNMQNSNTEYIGFIGMMILFVTINQIQRKFLEADITRDFYDEESLKYVYDSYGVPFYSAIPMEYHKKIVKNMNILLSHKGSTRVFYDIFDVFGFEAMNVFEYYMMKVHKFDNKKPVFVKNDDGTYNIRAMYDILFSKVRLYDDPTSSMIDKKNMVEYKALTDDDPYWITDEDLLNKIYSEEYNFMESKYLGIQTTFNLMKIIYESCYYLKMIIDNRKYLESTTIYNNNIHGNSNLFDLVIYTCALITKKYGFEGNIPSDLAAIGKVMGFNFKEDLVALKNNISENDYLKGDTKLLEYLETMDVNSLASIEKVYKNLTTLRTYLVDKMSETADVNVYWAYYELYQTVMYSEYVDDVFVKTDGSPAGSFSELLEDINPKLYNRLINDTEFDINSELSDTLYLLKNSCKQLSQLQYADNINIDNIIEYMFKLLDYFKSEKAALTGYEITYSLVSRTENIMKLMNIITHITDDYTKDPQYSIIDELYDFILIIRDYMKLYSILDLDDDIALEKDKMRLQSALNYLHDYIAVMLFIFYDMTSDMTMDDFLKPITNKFYMSSKLEFGDSVKLLYDEVVEILKYVLDEPLPIYDMIMPIVEYIYGTDSDSTEKLLFECKLALICKIKLPEPSVITHKDNMKLELWIQKGLDKNWFEDLIVSIFSSIHGLSSNMNVDVIIEKMKEWFHLIGQSEMPVDTLMDLYAEIVPLIRDVEENHIQYLDQMVQRGIRYFIDEGMLTEGRLSCTDRSLWRNYTDFSLLDSIMDQNSSKGKTEFGFSDMLILLHETKEEE